MNKKVLIITYYWPPSGGAGVQRWLKFAKYLPEYGWEPIILTVNPEQASYPQHDPSFLKECENITTVRTNTFELYSLYTSLKKNKEIPYGGFSNEQEPNLVQKAARFARGNFFIPDPRKGWNKYAIAKAKEIIKEHDIEVVISTSPPHSTQLIGLAIKKAFPSIKWIADLRDPWTDIYFYNKFFQTKIAQKIDRSYEKAVATNANVITLGVSYSIKNILKNRYPSSNIEVLTNGYDSTDFDKIDKTTISKNKEIVYTGTLTTDYPLKEIIGIAKKCREIKFRFIGSTPSEFRNLIEKEGLKDNFIFEKTIPHDKIIKRMVEAGILLLLIPQVIKNEGILTGKIFEYLGSQAPILAIGPVGGDVEKIIEETESGKYFTYDSINNIEKEEIEELFSNKSNEGYKDYSRRNTTKKLVEIIESL